VLIDKKHVMKFLPHREPFLFVDGVESVTLAENVDASVKLQTKDLVGTTVVAHFHARADHPIFVGHFPGKPILPGVVQVEMMAQASSFVLTKIYAEPYDVDMDVALLGVEATKFRKPVLPGMDLVISAICTKVRGSFMSYDCKIHQAGELMSESSVLAVVKITERK
jgi:3-hydroxyacyl-[acyl-carrier-protein] dehydratase